MTTLRLDPKPDPRTRDEWVAEIVEERTETGFVYFQYAVRPKSGAQPFLQNDHRAQLRTNHQRIVHGPNGGLMHVSGVEVLDEEEFAKDARFYRWQDKDRAGRWRADDGRVLAPFLFPTAPWAGGKDEELDPQWVRETFTLDLATQREECVHRYLDRAAAHEWEGDKRGTTLNLQVGASSDDALQLGAGATPNLTGTVMISDNRDEWLGWRWTGATIPQGATVNTAVIQVMPSTTANDEPDHEFDFEDHDDAPTFAAVADDIASRTYTGNVVTWSSADLGADGSTFFSTPSMVTPLQDVVNRGGFASDAIVAACRGKVGADGSRDLGVVTYDGATMSAGKLDIDYTASGGASHLAKILQQMGV